MPDNTYIEIPNTEERKQNQNVKHLNLIDDQVLGLSHLTKLKSVWLY
jgi:hypothetical protein